MSHQIKSAFLGFALLFMAGCSTQPPLSYHELLALPASERDTVTIQDLQSAFFAEEESAKKLQEIRDYERQVINLIDVDPPYRLGPLGTAIVDRYPGSLAGQLALTRFYTTLEDENSKIHQSWLDRITTYMSEGRDGSIQKPYRALSLGDATGFLVEQRNDAPIGAMYDTSDDFPLLARVVVRREDSAIEDVYFEIQQYGPIGQTIDDKTDPSPIDVIVKLAHEGESAAQLAYAIAILNTFDSRHAETSSDINDGLKLLRSSRHANNILPYYYYADFFSTQAYESDNSKTQAIIWNEARKNYRTAISSGYDAAMFKLGRLYLLGSFGTSQKEKGVELLTDASSIGHPDSSTTLGWVYSERGILEPDLAKSNFYFRQGAIQGGSPNKLDYIRHLTEQEKDQPVDDEALQWLLDIASEKNVDAMQLLGKVYAKGLHQRIRLRDARSWYKRAAKTNPTDAANINDIAWILATSNIDGLRQPRYSIKIMDTMMKNDLQARRYPPYIDTWAAAYAAVGNFDRAVSLQQEALDLALKNDTQTRMVDELRKHLQAFENGQALTEEVP